MVSDATKTAWQGQVPMLTVELPWPDRRLHPNARVHWAEKASVTKRARLESKCLARHVIKAPINAQEVLVTAIFHPPDRKKRDRDGLLASLKAAFDGISEVIGVDDSRWEYATKLGEVRRPACVILQIETIPCSP